MIRLAVNVRSLIPGQIGGLENAFRGVFDHLMEDPRFEITLLTAYFNDAAFSDWEGRARRVLLPEASRPTALEQLLGQDRFDLLYCPFLFLEPARPRLPTVLMIPDVQHREFPEFFPWEVLAARLRDMRASASYSRQVLTISEFSKREIMKAFDLPEDHVSVTLLDCAPEFRGPANPARVASLRAELALPDRYLLFPANNWPHKNHRNVFRALSSYRARYGDPPKLVLCGATVGSVDIDAEAEAAGVADLVLRSGWVERADLPFLFDGAEAVLFTTLYEGFGIPVVEAMRRGRPLVASNTTSVPEIAGDAAWLVDPRDPDAIAEGLHAALNSPETAARVELGRERAKLFDYAGAAEKTAAVFERVVAEHHGDTQLRAKVDLARRPKVFVVTPSFNQAEFLRETIDSVLAQDYPNLEYFVADGGSADGSVEILESYGDRIAWRSGADGGQAAAIAAAWRKAGDADIVAWLNSDDYYLPGAVTAAVDYLLRNPELSMVYGDAWYIDRHGTRTGAYPTADFDRERLAGNCFICQPAAFLRREVFQVVDFPDPGLRYAMDYDLWIRVSEHFRAGRLLPPRYLATSRLYAENKTLGQREGVYREIMQVSQRHFGSIGVDWSLGYAHWRGSELARKVFWFLPRPLQHWLTNLAMRRLNNQTGRPLYSDGWAGRRATIVLGAGVERATLRCESPYWPYRRALVVRVLHEKRVIADASVTRRGKFEIDIELPLRRMLPSVLTIEANRDFVPRKLGASEDPRGLAFRVLEIHQEPARLGDTD